MVMSGGGEITTLEQGVRATAALEPNVSCWIVGGLGQVGHEAASSNLPG
jgi:hypothetical protein